MNRRAMKFLTEPVRDQDLLDAIHVGLACDWRPVRIKTVAALRARFVTPCEREVMALWLRGVARDMGVSKTTVTLQRAVR